MVSNDEFFINEIRAYSVINLLEGAAVIEASLPKDATLSANNLLENQETRSNRQDINAIIDWDGVFGSTVTRAS